MKRGDVYFIKSNNKEEGVEIHANRPAVIVSNDAANEHSELLEVCYLTTAPKKDLPTHVLTRSCLRPSTIIAEQITTVSKTRVGDYIGRITPDEQAALDKAMAISLGIDYSYIQPEPWEQTAGTVLWDANYAAVNSTTRTCWKC